VVVVVVMRLVLHWPVNHHIQQVEPLDLLVGLVYHHRYQDHQFIMPVGVVVLVIIHHQLLRVEMVAVVHLADGLLLPRLPVLPILVVAVVVEHLTQMATNQMQALLVVLVSLSFHIQFNKYSTIKLF
jgi:hypothetical protein